jgi:hypothetical protein
LLEMGTGVTVVACGSRSPLLARLTETVTPGELFAVTGLVNAQMRPAIRPLNSKAAAIFLNLWPNKSRMARSNNAGSQSRQ